MINCDFIRYTIYIHHKSCLYLRGDSYDASSGFGLWAKILRGQQIVFLRRQNKALESKLPRSFICQSFQWNSNFNFSGTVILQLIFGSYVLCHFVISCFKHAPKHAPLTSKTRLKSPPKEAHAGPCQSAKEANMLTWHEVQVLESVLGCVYGILTCVQLFRQRYHTVKHKSVGDTTDWY